jgi:Mn-containing catalase
MTFPQELEHRQFSYQFINFSEGAESAEGRWAKGPTPDGKGEFTFVGTPEAHGSAPDLNQAPPNVHGTNKMPVPPSVGEASVM